MSEREELITISNKHTTKESSESQWLEKKTKLGIIYTVISNGGQFIIRFGSSIILARILFPEDFGLMAIVSIVLQLATRLTNFGFAMVLVQRKEITREHLNTVFITNTCLMTILTGVVYLSGSCIADYFGNARVEPLVKVISLNFLFLAITSVPRAILRRQMRFKELEMTNAYGKFVGVLFSVCLALTGFGIWSLVYGHLIESAFLALLLSYYSKWLPKFRFCISAFKDVFGFGLWVYVAGYVNYGIKKVDFFVVGKLLNLTQLGFYERAFNLMSLPRQQIAHRIGLVMFSSYSRIQDNKIKTVELLTKVLLYISLITYPLMIWMFFTAPALIVNLFGDKWLPSVYPFQVMCLAGILDTLTLVMEPTVTAGGYIGHRVRRDIVYLFVLALSVLIGTRWGIDGVAWGTTVASVFRLILMLNLIQKTLPFSFRGFLRAQKSALIYSAALIVSLLGVQTLIAKSNSIYSLKMLICMTATFVLVMICTQIVFRFKDVGIILDQLLLDFRALKKKLVQA